MNNIDTNYWKHKYCTIPIKGKHSETIAERLDRINFGNPISKNPDEKNQITL